MKKGTAIFPGWLFPFVYCVAGVDAYEIFKKWDVNVGYKDRYEWIFDSVIDSCRREVV